MYLFVRSYIYIYNNFPKFEYKYIFYIFSTSIQCLSMYIETFLSTKTSLTNIVKMCVYVILYCYY